MYFFSSPPYRLVPGKCSILFCIFCCNGTSLFWNLLYPYIPWMIWQFILKWFSSSTTIKVPKVSETICCPHFILEWPILDFQESVGSFYVLQQISHFIPFVFDSSMVPYWVYQAKWVFGALVSRYVCFNLERIQEGLTLSSENCSLGAMKFSNYILVLDTSL